MLVQGAEGFKFILSFICNRRHRSLFSPILISTCQYTVITFTIIEIDACLY
jgi:hypothetical protein